MGYIPNTVAKSLVANQTWTIGIELAAISDPFMGRVVEGVEQAAIEAGSRFLSVPRSMIISEELPVLKCSSSVGWMASSFWPHTYFINIPNSLNAVGFQSFS